MASSNPQISIQTESESAWRKIAAMPPGGTVVGLSVDPDGGPWLASPGGLFKPTVAGWSPVVEGLPFQEVNAVQAVGRTIFAAGLPGGVAYSTDAGRRWYAARIDQTQSPVACFAASPAFGRDGVILAGTQGAGVLRSSDGGRYWNLSNFGLRHFEILALAANPDWSQREQLYAATDGGVYESPNGGRAWRLLAASRRLGTVLCLALLPVEGHPSRAGGIMLAGTETQGLFSSPDGGQTWQQLDLGGEPGPVNSLCASPQGVILAGASALGLLRSVDGGRSWQLSGAPDEVVLSLAATEDAFYAGLHEHGLLRSMDGGFNWESLPGLHARRFSMLLPSPVGGWLAGGPTAGLWQLPVNADTWQALLNWPFERPLYALASAGGRVLAASLDGVWRSCPDGPGWSLALQTESGINSLAARGKQAWAGQMNGELWRSTDAGESWQAMPPVFKGQALVAIEVSTHFEKDNTLLAASAHPARQEVNFWRSLDAGLTWTSWFIEQTPWYAVQLAPVGEQASESSFGVGLTVLTQSLQGLRRMEITLPGAPIISLLALPGSPALLAATGQTLLVALDGQDWKLINTYMLNGAAVRVLVISPKFSQDRLVMALTINGDLWELPV